MTLRPLLALVLAGASCVAVGEETTKSLEEIVVEATAPGDFDDVEAWDREVRDALERAKLKQRSELTQHDLQQILILEQEMPVLKKSLDEIQRLVRAHRFRQTLTQNETLKLARAYEKAEAILENIPDAMMPDCKKVHAGGRRNKMTTCGVDYLAIERQLDEVKRRAGQPRSRSLVPVVPQKDQPFFTMTSPPKGEGEHPVHVQHDHFKLEQVRVTFVGDSMVLREDFHAIATNVPELRPAHAFRVELPTGTGMSLTSADKLPVIGYVALGKRKLRVVMLPRAAAIGYGIVVNDDDTFEGTLVAFEYAPTARRQLQPVNGLRAVVLPADAQLLRQYEFDSTVAEQPFVRYDVVFEGVNDGLMTLYVRHFDAPASEDPVHEEKLELPAQTGTISVAGMDIEIRELETERIKYVVRAAQPALAHASAAGAGGVAHRAQ